MDFERATLKAIFYDYPIEAAIKAVEETKKFGGKDVLMDILPQLVRWREQAFTTTEARMMDSLAQNQWMNSCSQDWDNKFSCVYKPLLLVRNIANKLLTEDNDQGYPIVQFNNLFRWKDATQYVGEDLLSIAYVADRDSKCFPKNDPIFLWSDILRHNDPNINRILDSGLSDVHAHYNATADVFYINWMALMNDLTKRNLLAQKIAQYQDVMFTTADTERIIPIHRLCIAAAYLRAKFFEIFVLGQDIGHRAFDRVFDLLRSDFDACSERGDLQAEIDMLRQRSMHTPYGTSMDYAIRDSAATVAHQDDIHILFQGEREVLYKFMLRYYSCDKKAWNVAPYFYLYLLIKTRVRKEFVQINDLIGFENFQTYQDRKGACLIDDDRWSKQFGKYVVQTTLRLNKNDYLEARITPTSLQTIKEDFEHSVFTINQVKSDVSKRLSFVAHFIKPDYTRKEKKDDLRESNRDGSARYANYRGKLKVWVDDVLKVYSSQKKFENLDLHGNMPKLVGIDAASTEMFCRPEVFGHVYRFAKIKGIYHRTFHVGEDFFDIIDGLRAIDEAILFLDLDSNCRIGHALAIGIDAIQYYKNRKRKALMPRQYILDNCVWTLMRAAQNNLVVSNSLETELTRLAKKMYIGIGYSGTFDINTYWNSILLRGNESNNIDNWNADIPLTDWDKTAIVTEKEVKDAMEDLTAKNIYKMYLFSHSIKEKGDENIAETLPEGIDKVVKDLQQIMLKKLSEKNIAVECNPTSNLKIGCFERYDMHPLLTTFDPIDQKSSCAYPFVNASVNTDDRGVFATSTYLELSLMALALQKQQVYCKEENIRGKYSPRVVEEYIERIRVNGYHQRFRFLNE